MNARGELVALANEAVVALGKYDAAKAAVALEKKELARCVSHRADATEALAVFQATAAEVQTTAHGQIAGVVTQALQTVAPELGYSFRVHFDRKRGKTQARMVFVKEGHEVNPMTADSGGFKEIAALALRVATLVLATPKRRKVLILDEPFGGVSKEFMPRVAELLMILSHDLGVQFVISTHSPALEVGKVIHVGAKYGKGKEERTKRVLPVHRRESHSR